MNRKDHSAGTRRSQCKNTMKILAQSTFSEKRSMDSLSAVRNYHV